jgi:Tol biopolymer transport system component
VTDFPNDELYIVNLDGSEHSKITNGYRPVFSPDHKSIIFEKVEANNHGYLINYIFSYNLFYKTSQKLTRRLMAKISPDGSKILYIDHNYLEEDLGSYRGELLYLADVNGQNPKLIFESEYSLTDYFQFLPDGSKIIYTHSEGRYLDNK